MAEKNNATCSICGNPYYLCMSCKDKMKLHPWKMHCCSSSHFKVFQVVRGFSTGVYTKDEFKSKLKNIDLSDLNSFRPHIKKIIEDALKEENNIEIVKSVDDIIEDKNIEAESDLVIDNIKIAETIDEVIEKPVYSRKRNYKIETE